MEQTSVIVTLRVAPGVSLLSGSAPRSNAAPIELLPRRVKWLARILPTVAAMRTAAHNNATARVAEVKCSNHHEPASRLDADSASRALNSARGPAMGGNGGSRVCRWARAKSAMVASISAIRARQPQQAARWA